MKKIVEFVVCKLLSKQIQTEEQKEVYIYGATLLITTLIGVFSIVLLSFAFFSIFDAFLFLTIFSAVRACAGGYHCKTYINCFIVSNITFLLVMGISMAVLSLPVEGILLIDSSLIVVSWIYIICNAPIVPLNHFLSPKRTKKNRKRAMILSSVISLCSLGFAILFFDSAWVLHCCTVSALTETSISVLMHIEKRERRKKNV